MYPFIRMPYQLWRHRKDAALPPLGTHESQHICWPWDLDFWMELNNGRTLTLYDLGRIPLAARTGLTPVLQRKRWAMSIVGASVRYRRRVRAFDRLTMKSRMLGWDDRFVYSEQAMWRSDGECSSHALFRSAVTGGQGIIAPKDVLAEMGHAGLPSPPLPDWAQAWVAAEATRVWPPMRDA